MKTVAPFTQEQVKNINDFQTNGKLHPFTCIEHSNTPLVCKEDGLYCTKCNYTQNWVHNFMASEEGKNFINGYLKFIRDE